MDKNNPSNTKTNQPPKPIQGNKESEKNFNVHKNPDAKNAAPQAIDKKNVEDMDGNSNQKVKNDANGKIVAKGNESSGSKAMTADQWKTKVSSAKNQWNKLQQEELVATCGDCDEISTLVQKRYSMNKIDADKQVNEFLGKH